MHPAGIAHTALAAAALVLGAVVFGSAKGTQQHRLVGVCYVFALFGTNLTALTIFLGSGGFGVFHVLAVANVALVLVGFTAAFRKRPRGTWLHYHYYFITWSYVGLCAAAGAEAGVRIPGVPFGAGVAVPTVAITLAGGAWVHLRHRATLARVRSGAAPPPPAGHRAGASGSGGRR